jgi:tight adherence protein C
MVFLGSKIVCAVALPLLWVVVAASTGRAIGNTVIMMMLMAFIGFYAPTLFVGWMQKRRHGAILAALPDSLDLLVVCVEAGLGMTAALLRVSQEMRFASPELSDEFALVHQQMQTGVSRTESLRNLAQRTGVDDIYSLVAMLIQTDRLGTSVAGALRSHAEAMRTKRRQRAEQMARRAGVLLSFPLIFLILPALLIIIMGPAAIQLAAALGAQ